MAFVQDSKGFEGGKPAAMADASQLPGEFVFKSSKSKGAINSSAPDRALEEIAMFSLEAGDELDLTEIAAHFNLSPDETVGSLRLAPVGSATLVSLDIGDRIHDLVLLHGVSPAALRAARPWVFNAAAEDVLERFDYSKEAAADGAPVGTLILEEPIEPEHLYLNRKNEDFAKGSLCPLADAFVFDKAMTAHVPSQRPDPDQTDLSNVSGALGVSYSQVLEALHAQMKGADHSPIGAVAAALDDADKLVV